MTLSDVQGQPRAVDALQAALSHGAVHHAWLLTGPSGVGKELAALGMAQALVCPVAPRDGCGKCPACTRVAHFHHPDVLWLMPEEERGPPQALRRERLRPRPSREIRVEQMRRLQERLALRALEAPRKVVLLLPADAMNPQAQNAFLKTLEEPPPDTVLIGVTAAPDRLLPTLRSRCVKVAFGPLPHAFVRDEMQRRLEVTPDVAAAVASLAGGSLGRALGLDVERLADRRRTHRALRGADRVGPAHRAPLRRRGGEQPGGGGGDPRAAHGVGAGRGGDRAGGETLANPDLQPLARRWRRASTTTRCTGDRLLDDAQVAIGQRNGSPRLQLERMLLEMEGMSEALDGVLAEVKAGKVRPLYLFWGEEFLVRRGAEELVKALVPDAAAGLNFAVLDAASPREVPRSWPPCRSSPGARWWWSATPSSSRRRRAGGTRWARRARRGRPGSARSRRAGCWRSPPARAGARPRWTRPPPGPLRPRPGERSSASTWPTPTWPSSRRWRPSSARRG